MSNDLIQKGADAGLPVHLQKYYSDKVIAEQVGHLDSSDIGINMIKLAQSSNRETKKAGWGPTGQEPQIPLGSYFLKNSGRILVPDQPSSVFIPLVRTVRFIKWIGKPGQGQMEFMTDDPNDKRIGDGLKFRKDPNSGENLPPLVTKYINFYVAVPGEDMPVLLSFKRTSAPVGRALTQALFSATKGNKIPYFCFLYQLTTPKEDQDGNNQWFLPAFKPLGHVPAEYENAILKKYEMALALKDATTAAEFEGDVEHDAPAQQAVHPNAGVVKQVEATIVSTPQTVAPPQQPFGNAPAPAPVTVQGPAVVQPVAAQQAAAPATVKLF